MDEELIDKIREYYLEQNHTQVETLKYFDISKYKLTKIIKENNLYKSSESKKQKCKQGAKRTKRTRIKICKPRF